MKIHISHHGEQRWVVVQDLRLSLQTIGTVEGIVCIDSEDIVTKMLFDVSLKCMHNLFTTATSKSELKSVEILKIEIYHSMFKSDV
jgi:hypothetical protein